MTALKKLMTLLVCSAAMMAMITSCGTTRKSISAQPVHSGSEQPSSSQTERPAPGSVAEALVSEAEAWLGTPYLWAGNTKDGVDCSGFIMAVYRDAAGIRLPRTTRDMNKHCRKVDSDRRAVGDLLFFSSRNSGGQVAHVGMYIGNNTMIHASSSRGVVKDNLSLKYYREHFIGVGRPPMLADATPQIRKDKQSKDRQKKETPATTQTEKELAKAGITIANPAATVGAETAARNPRDRKPARRHNTADTTTRAAVATAARPAAVAAATPASDIADTTIPVASLSEPTPTPASKPEPATITEKPDNVRATADTYKINNTDTTAKPSPATIVKNAFARCK